MRPPDENQPGQGSPRDKSLSLCPHCELLGASSVVRSDSEATDILHCTLCRLTFQFITEGNKIIVTQITPYTGES